MAINNRSSSSMISFLTLITGLIIVSEFNLTVNCLSLNEIHSSLPSTDQYRSHTQNEKTVRDTLRNMRKRQHHLRFSDQHSIPSSFPFSSPSSSDAVERYSLPADLGSNLNYLMSSADSLALIPDKRQDEQVMDIPMEYTADIPYEFYPELWPSNLVMTSPDSELTGSDIFSQILAEKIARLLEQKQRSPEVNRAAFIPSLAERKKRTLVKRNNRMSTHRVRSGQQHSSPSLPKKKPVKSVNSNKLEANSANNKLKNDLHGDRKFGKLSAKSAVNRKQTNNRKYKTMGKPNKGESQAVRAKDHRTLPVNTYIRKTVNATSPKESSGKLRKSQGSGFRPMTSLNTKEKVKIATRKPFAKEIFNEMTNIGTISGPKRVVKRSTSLAISKRDLNNFIEEAGRDDVPDIRTEIDDSISEQQPSLVIQSNPWLVDEATRTLMRSLAVKRRKRGDQSNDDKDADDNDDLTIDDGNIDSNFADIFDFDKEPKQVTKKTEKEEIKIDGQVPVSGPLSSIGLADDGDDDGANDTFFEEEFAEGLISIGDSGDLEEVNGTSASSSDKKKRTEANDVARSSSTMTPISAVTATSSPEINLDDERLEEKIDDLIKQEEDEEEQQEADDEEEKRLVKGIVNIGLADNINDQSDQVKRKRKRSVSAPYFGRVDESLAEEEEAKFTNVDDKLEKIEETLIWEALELIKGNLNKEEPGKSVRRKIESRLDAAYDLEDMRLALDDLHKTMQKMSSEDSNEPDDGSESDDDTDQRQQQQKTVARNKYHSYIPSNHELDSYDSDKCSSLQLLTSDCSAVKDVVPSGQLQKFFGQACNWHEVCYSCGGAYGLLSSDCDMGFLEQSRLACNDSSSCETVARLILMPLRQRRTFYKRKIPEVCYRQSCVGTFLLASKRR